MSFEQLTTQYIKDCLTIKHDRSQEYYFGENNRLKVRLISWFEQLRDRIYAKAKSTDNFLPKDALPILKEESKKLETIICEEFNIEGCTVGWINQVNASCFGHLGNSDLFGTSDNAKELRLKLNDILDTGMGFRYKSKKGIYYVISLGYPLAATDDFFTVEEAAAILVHELGHAMQHIVNSFNKTVSMQVYESLYRVIGSGEINFYSPDAKREIKQLFKRLRKAVNDNDEKTINAIATKILDDSKDYQGTSFSKMDDDKIQGYLESGMHSDWELDKKKSFDNKVKTAADKRNSFGHKIKNFITGLVSVSNYLLLIPIALGWKHASKNPDLNQFKLFEETADDFCQIYGLGLGQASAMKKFATMSDQTKIKTGGFLERVPIFDLFWSIYELKEDYVCAMYGYPTDKQRMMNLYRSAKFELQNNKDLTSSQKSEIQKQLEDYKTFYDEFVKLDSKKGWFYRLLSGLNRDSIEIEAKKDTYVYKHVLIPLQKRMDPSFDPYKEYADVMNDSNVK